MGLPPCDGTEVCTNSIDGLAAVLAYKVGMMLGGQGLETTSGPVLLLTCGLAVWVVGVMVGEAMLVAVVPLVFDGVVMDGVLTVAMVGDPWVVEGIVVDLAPTPESPPFAGDRLTAAMVWFTCGVAVLAVKGRWEVGWLAAWSAPPKEFETTPLAGIEAVAPPCPAAEPAADAKLAPPIPATGVTPCDGGNIDH